MLKLMKNYFRLVAEGYKNDFLAKCFMPLLTLVAAIYGVVSSLTRTLYEKGWLKQKRLPFPVVSVGNLTWGGTGKTPFVEYLARRIADRRRHALVLTRGYGQDEVAQLKKQLPKATIGVGKNRVKTALAAFKKERIHVGILDDGLQHWPVVRNLEVVMINALNPFGNGHLIPRGILREPLVVLKKASFVVISHSNLISKEALDQLKEKIKALAPNVVTVDAYLEPLFFYRAQKRARVFVERLKDHRVTTFSGIGTPRSFQMLLNQNQIRTVRNFEFTDHHQFTDEDLNEVKRMSESSSSDEIITTEKDYYRSPKQIAKILNPLVLATRLRIASGEEVLNRRLVELLGVGQR